MGRETAVTAVAPRYAFLGSNLARAITIAHGADFGEVTTVFTTESAVGTATVSKWSACSSGIIYMYGLRAAAFRV